MNCQKKKRLTLFKQALKASRESFELTCSSILIFSLLSSGCSPIVSTPMPLRKLPRVNQPQLPDHPSIIFTLCISPRDNASQAKNTTIIRHIVINVTKTSIPLYNNRCPTWHSTRVNVYPLDDMFHAKEYCWKKWMKKLARFLSKRSAKTTWWQNAWKRSSSNRSLLDTRPRWRFAANCRHFSLHTLPLLFSFFVPSCGPSPSSESRGESVRARAGHGRGTATDTSSSSRFTLSLVRRLPLFLFVGRFVAAGLFLLFCRLFVVGVFFDGCVRAALFQTRKTTARGKINWRGIFRGGTFCPFSSILTSLFIPWSFASPPPLYPLFLRFQLHAFHQTGIWSTAQMGDVRWHNRSSQCHKILMIIYGDVGITFSIFLLISIGGKYYLVSRSLEILFLYSISKGWFVHS